MIYNQTMKTIIVILVIMVRPGIHIPRHLQVQVVGFSKSKSQGLPRHCAGAQTYGGEGYRYMI